MQPGDSALTEPPVSQAPARPAGARPRHAPAGLGILVVEDDHWVRLMVQLGLERCGFDVWSAPNGCAAVSLYGENHEAIDLVLLGVHLPDMDGPQILQALAALNPGILACFMVGFADSFTREELVCCGAAHVIAKPFRVGDLANTLRLLAQRSPQRGGACHLDAAEAHPR